MPLHSLFCSQGLYSPEDMQQIVEKITELYAEGRLRRGGSTPIPDFYCVVNFVPSDNLFVAKKKQDRFLRIVIHHLAATWPQNAAGEKMKEEFMDIYSDMLRPFTLDRGISYEVECLQSDQALWRMNGLRPPTVKEAERLQSWREAGKPLL